MTETELNEYDFEQDDTQLEDETPAPAEDEETPEPSDDDEESSAPEEPETSPEPTEMEKIRAELASAREREERLLALIEKQGQAPEPAKTGDPVPDVMDILRDTFEGETLEAMTKIINAVREEGKHTYARREEFERSAQTTQQIAMKEEETRTMNEFVSRGVPESDVKEAHRRIYAHFEKTGKPNPEWPNAKAAFKDVLNDIMIERQYKKADAVAASKKAVHDRQAKTATPESAPPSAKAKVRIDTLELRKKLGRKPSTMELIEAAEAAG